MWVWTEGYVTEIDYTHGSYRELAHDAALCADRRGYLPPADDAPYLELGYGRGMSAVIQAASTPCPVWGTDFNPAHAANTQSLVAAAGIDAHMYDDSFAELENRSDGWLVDCADPHARERALQIARQPTPRPPTITSTSGFR